LEKIKQLRQRFPLTAVLLLITVLTLFLSFKNPANLEQAEISAVGSLISLLFENVVKLSKGDSDDEKSD
jgi:hypothetical protein